MHILIDVPYEMYQKIKNDEYTDVEIYCGMLSIQNGTPLPKGHGELFDKTEILRFLKCPNYENCDWKNCFDCNESRCINLNNVNDLVPIIEADSEVKSMNHCLDDD